VTKYKTQKMGKGRIACHPCAVPVASALLCFARESLACCSGDMSMAYAGEKESSELRVQLLFKWWESALALAKETAHTEGASFSRASSKKRRFERSKLSSHQATNKKFRDLNAQSSARRE
jgi:hypothetical protein